MRTDDENLMRALSCESRFTIELIKINGTIMDRDSCRSIRWRCTRVGMFTWTYVLARTIGINFIIRFIQQRINVHGTHIHARRRWRWPEHLTFGERMQATKFVVRVGTYSFIEMGWHWTANIFHMRVCVLVGQNEKRERREKKKKHKNNRVPCSARLGAPRLIVSTAFYCTIGNNKMSLCSV